MPRETPSAFRKVGRYPAVEKWSLPEHCPAEYSKFDLPNETMTEVNVGIDIKDIPKIADKEFSVTLNAFFVVRWKDERLVIDQV